jgi:hypothetical protein
MEEEYHKARGGPPGEAKPQAGSETGEPPVGMAVRRYGDRCFHAVEEIVKEGYIVEGILFAHEDVAEVRGEAGKCGSLGDQSAKPRAAEGKGKP